MRYYSEKLDRLFDNEKDLINEENAAEKAAAEKTKKAEAKKAEAKVVEDAFKARNAARTEYNKNVAEAKKIYTESLQALRTTFDETVTAENKKLDAAEKAYDTALKEFTDKHGSYHMTLRDGDNVLTLHSDNKAFDFTNAFKIFDIMDSFFRI